MPSTYSAYRRSGVLRSRGRLQRRRQPRRALLRLINTAFDQRSSGSATATARSGRAWYLDSRRPICIPRPRATSTPTASWTSWSIHERTTTTTPLTTTSSLRVLLGNGDGSFAPRLRPRHAPRDAATLHRPCWRTSTATGSPTWPRPMPTIANDGTPGTYPRPLRRAQRRQLDGAAPSVTIGDVTVTEGNTGTDGHLHRDPVRGLQPAGHRQLRHRRRHRHGRQRLPGRLRHADDSRRPDQRNDHRAGQRRPPRRSRTRPSSSTSAARPTRPSPTARGSARSSTTNRGSASATRR